MSETEKRVLATFSRILPHLPEEGKEKLLTLGEGIAIGAGMMKPEECSSLAENKQQRKRKRPENKELEPTLTRR